MDRLKKIINHPKYNFKTKPNYKKIKNNKTIFNRLKKIYSIFNNSDNIILYITAIKNNWTNKTLKCINPSCKKPKQKLDVKKGFGLFCSKECRENNKELFYNHQTQSKIKSNLKKYNVKNVMQVKDIKQKQEQTMLQKYYVKVPLHNKAIKKKFLYKLKNTTQIEKNKKIKKFRKTLIEKNKKTSKKDKLETKQQLRKTHIDLNKTLKNKHFWDNKKFIEDTFLDDKKYIKIHKFQKFFGCSNSIVYIQFKRLKIKYNKSSGYSQKEKDVVNFISTFYKKDIIENIKGIINNKYELDIYLPDINLAIEYNGEHWHCCKNDKNFLKNKYRHHKKTIMCHDKNIELIHIYENFYEKETLEYIKEKISAYNFKLNKNYKEPEILYYHNNYPIYDDGVIIKRKY